MFQTNLDMMHIYITSIKNFDKGYFPFFLKYVEPIVLQRVSNKRKENDKKRTLIGNILAKVVIKKFFGIDIVKQKFTYSEHGKPYLQNYPHIHFNISHSGEYVACAVSDNAIGVDIQKIDKYNYDVAKRVCNEKELKQIEDSLDRASEFAKLWTQKEAVLKMYGTGIASGDIKNCLKNQKVKSKKIDDYWLSVATSIDRA